MPGRLLECLMVIFNIYRQIKMNMETKKSDNLQESQKPKQRVDRSRRSFAKTGLIAPVLMSLSSKTALGSVYQCSISGAQSGNQSSHGPKSPSACAFGISPANWAANAGSSTTLSGGLTDWLAGTGVTGIIPFSINTSNQSVSYNGTPHFFTSPANGTWQSWQAIYTAINTSGLGTSATAFNSIFGGSITATFFDLFTNSSTTLEANAAAAYLNAAIVAMNPGKASTFANGVFQHITTQDIISLYHLSKQSISSFTSSTGLPVTGTFNGGIGGNGVAAYLAGLHS